MEYIIDVLVGGAITVLNNMKVNGKEYPIYYRKNMFETTNQFSMNSPCFCGAQFWIHPQMGLSQGKKRDFWKWHQTIVTFISIQPAQNFFFTQKTCGLQLTQQNCGFCPLKNASAKPGWMYWTEMRITLASWWVCHGLCQNCGFQPEDSWVLW